MIHIGVIREGKSPSDSRVPLTPDQCAQIDGLEEFRITVQSSEVRCIADSEYLDKGVAVREDIAMCDILLGVKEVPVSQLLPDKTYFFFSHTIKEQPYNQGLLRSVLDKRIRLIDYEVLTDEHGARLIAFGKFAGMVGAHNALWTLGQRTGAPELPRMKDCRDYAAVQQVYQATEFPTCKVALTGTGRVANGAAMVLNDMGFHKVTPGVFCEINSSRPVYTQLGVTDYARRIDGADFTEKHFFRDPDQFTSDFAKFWAEANVMINGIFWDPRAPAFFTQREMQSATFAIKVIADVTCDIAPVSSIPSTLRATTIDNPVFGFDPATGLESDPHLEHVVDMMTIDNLPNELPRDASAAFGKQFIQHVLPEFLLHESAVLERATIASNGNLGSHFKHLSNYAGVS